MEGYCACAYVCVRLLRIVGIYFCAFLPRGDTYAEGDCARAYGYVCLLRRVGIYACAFLPVYVLACYVS